MASTKFNHLADCKQIHMQLKAWQSKLPEIQAVLNDAEQKQIKNQGVKNWLADLQDLVYDMDDILDEFAYEPLSFNVQKNEASTGKLGKLLPTCCTTGGFIPTSCKFNDAMISQIKEITARMNALSARRTSLGLCDIMSEAAMSRGGKARLQPTSVLDDSIEYVGRDVEKLEILELLKSSSTCRAKDGVSVICILGLGGIGKTTLAQLAYNDSSVQNSFDHKAWVCVSDDFDIVTITKTILESITSMPCGHNDLNLLQVMLKEKLFGKKLLLVLDDIWNENYNDWTILRSPFGPGTKIIITIRLQNVSSIVDAVRTFQLDKLSHNDCLSIFNQHVVRASHFHGHLEFKEIAEKLARKCNGLPLAAKAIGGLLRTLSWILLNGNKYMRARYGTYLKNNVE